MTYLNFQLSFWRRVYSTEWSSIALFTLNFSHFHCNVIQCGCKAISGLNYKIARNCLAYMLDFTVMQMSKVNREKGYSGSETISITKFLIMIGSLLHNLHAIMGCPVTSVQCELSVTGHL